MNTRLNLSILTVDYYDLTSEQKLEKMERVKKAIKRKNNLILHKMMEVVEKNVTSYKQDFYIHDVELLHKYDVSFIWMVRDSGTQWINLENNYMVSETVSLIENDFEYHAKHSRIIAYYYYNKTTQTFNKISEQKGRALIKQQYEQMTA
jgi:hypothetical protein